MKTTYHLLLILALPLLTPTLSKANGPHEGPGDHGSVERERMERARHEKAPEERYLRERHSSGSIPRAEGQSGPRAPLDGGISLLLAAGIGLGVKKAAQRKKALKEKKTDVAG
jgi:hypothetical protein